MTRSDAMPPVTATDLPPEMVPGLPTVLPPDHHEVVDTDGDPRLNVEAQASQWRLMWLAFRRNRLAVLGLVIVALLYFVAAFAEFLAPFEASSYDSRAVYHPPQEFRLFDRSAEGGWDFAPHFVGMKLVRDPLTLQGEFQPDPESKIGVEFFTRGWSYNFLGLIPTDLHLFGPSDPDERFYLLGADRLGRDMLSRIIAGHADLDVDRPRRRRPDPRPRADPRRHRRLLRRQDRHRDPADHRAGDVAAEHSDLARPQRGDADGLVAGDPLLRHHADPLAGGLGRAGARRARPLPRPAQRGVRRRRPARRRLGGADHLPPHDALDWPATSSPASPWPSRR